MVRIICGKRYIQKAYKVTIYIERDGAKPFLRKETKISWNEYVYMLKNV